MDYGATTDSNNQPTVVLRAYQHSDDDGPLSAVCARRTAALGLDPHSVVSRPPSAETIADQLRADNADPAMDVIVAETDGAVVGFAALRWWTESDGTVVYLHSEFAHPDATGETEVALLRWVEARARAVAARDNTTQCAVLGANASSRELARTKLLLGHGYSAVFSQVEMVRSGVAAPPPVDAPPGFILATPRLDEMRPLWEFNNSVYAGRDWTRRPTEADYRDFCGDNPDLALWRVARTGADRAGLVRARADYGRGVVDDVSVALSYRRRGLASALLSDVLRALVQRGCTEVRLHTSGENVSGAQTLYRSLGFEVAATHVRYRAPLGAD